MSTRDGTLSFLDRMRSVWDKLWTFGRFRHRSDSALSLAARRFKNKLLRIGGNSPVAIAAIDSEALTTNIIALFDDPGFEKLDHNERTWIFATIWRIYTETGHSSGLRIIPSAERQLGILAKEPEIHLTSLCIAYDLLYFLYWFWSNSIDEQRGFADNVVRPFSAAIRRNLPAPTVEAQAIREKPIVGLLAQHLSPTPGNALAFANMLVLRSLSAAGYRTALFAWSHHDPATLAKVKAMGVDVHVVHQDWSTHSMISRIRATEALLRDVKPDVLITEMNSALPAVLFERRVAPVQIFYQTGLPYWPLKHLDGILNSWGVDPEKLEFPPEKCFFIPAPLDLPEYSKDIDSTAIVEERKKFPSGRLIGCYGRISKVTPAYIRTAAAIVETLDDVTVIIGGPGDAQPIRNAIAETNCAHKFLVVEGFVDGQIWGRLLDVFLDTYPQPGGLAVLEMIAKSKPAVHMTDVNVPNFGKFKVPELVATKPQTYIEISQRLLTDKKFYDEMTRATASLSATHPNEQDYAAVLSSAINKCIEASISKGSF